MKQKHFSPELERAILKLPYNTQRNFRNALKPHLFTSEQFVPTKYEAKKVESNKDIMRNKLIDFQNNLKNKKLFLSQISKETKTFSKGYKGVAIDNNASKQIKRDKILYQDLLKRYKDQGYDTNKLFSDTNNNLFTKSIFLENNNNYENTLNITGKKEGLQLEQYLEKVDNILKGHHKNENFKFNREVKFKDNLIEEDDDFFPYYNYTERIRNLKKEIKQTKKTIEDMNFNSNNEYKTISYYDGHNNGDYQNIISSTRTSYFDIINNLSKSKLNSTVETNFTIKHKKTKSQNLNVNFSNNLKQFVRENTENEENNYSDNSNEENDKSKNIIENDKANENEIETFKKKKENMNKINLKTLTKSQSIKKSRNHNSMMMNEPLVLSFKPNSFRKSVMVNQNNNNQYYKDISTRMNKKMKKLHEIQMEEDINNLYEEVKKKNFEESENEIYEYLKKYNKNFPEKLKYIIFILNL